MKSFKELVKEEELNDDYIPNVYDVVYRLPFVNSNNVNWKVGLVTKVSPKAPAEAWITTEEGDKIMEYCYYLYPVLNATNEKQERM